MGSGSGLRCDVRARGALAALFVLATTMTSAPVAAFGGFWSSPAAAVRQRAQRVLLVDNPDTSVTAVIELAYAGAATKFAWVVPVAGKPRVALSSSVVFARLDAATSPQYWVEVAVDGSCASHDPLGTSFEMDAGSYVDPSAPDTSGGPVLALDRGTVGPYDYVTLAVDPTAAEPAQAAIDWLRSEGYELTDRDRQVWTPYLQAGNNLLAFRLTKSADEGAIRPVMLTFESGLPTLPITLSGLAAGADLPIKVWVVGPSQAVSTNYPSLVLNDAMIDWLSGRKFTAGTLPAGGAGPFGPFVEKPKNYEAVVRAAADEAGGRGFVTELAGPTSQYRDKVWSANDTDGYAEFAQETFEDGVAAIRAAQSRYGRWDGWNEALESALTLPSGVSREQFSADPEQYRDAVTIDTAKFRALLDEKVVKPVLDTAALLARGPYLTRLYTVMSAEEMTEDPVFDYNADLAQVSNVHVAKQRARCAPHIPTWSDAPWQLELPQGGVVTGTGSAAWPLALGSLPTNLKIVRLGRRGAGDVVQDNAAQIRMRLFPDGSVPRDLSTYRAPQHGVAIGGAPGVRPLPTISADDPASERPATPTPAVAEPSANGGCSLAPERASPHLAVSLGFALLTGLLVQRRRRRDRSPLRSTRT